MDLPVREMDVCLHLPTRRRCLVVWAGADGTVRCVYDDDQFFDCPIVELVSYRHPRFSEALRLASQSATPGPTA